jgi:hypothetical protein
VHGLPDGGRGIVHGNLPRDEVSAVGQLPTEPLLMGVEDAAQHQFAAGVDEFDDHRVGSFAVQCSKFKEFVMREGILMNCLPSRRHAAVLGQPFQFCPFRSGNIGARGPLSRLADPYQRNGRIDLGIM